MIFPGEHIVIYIVSALTGKSSPAGLNWTIEYKN